MVEQACKMSCDSLGGKEMIYESAVLVIPCVVEMGEGARRGKNLRYYVKSPFVIRIILDRCLALGMVRFSQGTCLKIGRETLV